MTSSKFLRKFGTKDSTKSTPPHHTSLFHTHLLKIQNSLHPHLPSHRSTNYLPQWRLTKSALATQRAINQINTLEKQWEIKIYTNKFWIIPINRNNNQRTHSNNINNISCTRKGNVLAWNSLHPITVSNPPETSSGRAASLQTEVILIANIKNSNYTKPTFFQPSWGWKSLSTS